MGLDDGKCTVRDGPPDYSKVCGRPGEARALMRCKNRHTREGVVCKHHAQSMSTEDNIGCLACLKELRQVVRLRLVNWVLL